MNDRLVKREIFDDVAAHIKEREITVITGARQAGKTTLLLQLKSWLISSQKAGEEQIKFFNLDLLSDLAGIRDQGDFIKFLKEELAGEKSLYIFIDEIQRLENAGIFLKGIYDMDLPVKFIVSGSSSLEIRSRVSESLTGRKRVFHLWPFSFGEYIACHDSSLAGLVRKDDISSLNRKKVMDLFRDFAVFGGYPRVALAGSEKDKMAILNEIYSSYIEKDIVGFMKIRNPFAFSKLVTLLGDQAGGLVNLHELGATLGMNFRTVESYIFALENTFVIGSARPYFTNIRKELTKMPKIYFIDNGIRNLSVKYFANFDENRDRGKLLENFIASSIAKKMDGGVNYWRTKDKSEVDFVLKDFHGQVIPMEVKVSEFKKPEIPRGLKAFIEKYKPKRAFVVNLSLEEKIMLGHTLVSFILPYRIEALAEEAAKQSL